MGYLVALACVSGQHDGSPTRVLAHEPYGLESRIAREALMGSESSQSDLAAAAELSGTMQRLVAANLFPTEYSGRPPVSGPGVPLTGLPSDVDARLFAGAGGVNFVRIHDSFSRRDHWYTQGAIAAADMGEKIGRIWGTARWPAPMPPPTNLAGDRQVSADGEAIPVPDHVKGVTFRLFRAADGAGYVRMTDPAGQTTWLNAALLNS